MPRLRINPQAALLFAEAAFLVSIAAGGSHFWLLPLAALAIVFASLLSRGITVALPFCILISVWWLSIGTTRFPVTTDLPVVFPVLAILLGIASAFLGILSGLNEKNIRRDLHTKLAQLVIIIHFIAAGFLFADRFVAVSLASLLAICASVFCLLVSFDSLLKLLTRLYTPRRHWPQLPAPGTFFFFRWFGKNWRALLPSKASAEDEFSLKLPEMWMWPAIRNSLPALLITVLAILFASSAVHEIGPASQGVRHHFGKWDTAPLPAGLHVSLPYPFGGIRTVGTGEMRETVLGFRSDPGKPILWERAHYEGEAMSLVGGGDDLLSISVPIFYRIGNAADYLRSSTAPEKLLRDIGDRILLSLTVRRPAAEIMTTARESMRREFHTLLQTELDRIYSGLHIESVYLRDIHPPVEVAPFFQDVVAAMEDKEAYIHDGESYQRDIVTRARGTSIETITVANANAGNRLLRATGESSRFVSLSNARQENPSLYDLREGYRIFDSTLAGAKKAIFDDAMRAEMPTHLDLRKVLNPDFMSDSPPTPQSLVPRPGRLLDSFDLDIEGYLRTGQGEAPAIDSMPADPDNLLKK